MCRAVAERAGTDGNSRKRSAPTAWPRAGSGGLELKRLTTRKTPSIRNVAESFHISKTGRQLGKEPLRCLRRRQKGKDKTSRAERRGKH